MSTFDAKLNKTCFYRGIWWRKCVQEVKRAPFVVCEVERRAWVLICCYSPRNGQRLGV